jgi:hypothetical protein
MYRKIQKIGIISLILLLIVFLGFSTFIIFIFINDFTMYEDYFYTFNTYNEAKEKLGNFKVPQLPEIYELTKITYDESFTTPVLEIYYKSNEENIIFTKGPEEIIEGKREVIKDSNLEMIWIHGDSFFILTWSNKKDLYHYFLKTTNSSNKNLLINLALEYENGENKGDF